MSDLREKVAKIVDPFSLEVRTFSPFTGEPLATEALLKADRIISICMEEARLAARVAYLRLTPEQRANGDILDDAVTAAIRSLKGGGDG